MYRMWAQLGFIPTDQNPRCPLEDSMEPCLPTLPYEDSDAQADLSLGWAHIQSFRKCYPRLTSYMNAFSFNASIRLLQGRRNYLILCGAVSVTVTGAILTGFSIWLPFKIKTLWCMSRNVRKRTVGHVRPAKIQIRPRSLIRIFAVRILDSQGHNVLFMQTTKILIILGRSAGWFESSLGRVCQKVLFLTFLT